jgi:hypothetical protein
MRLRRRSPCFRVRRHPCQPAAAAEPAEELFKGRKVSIYVSTGPGGGYDAYGRMLARHLGRHLPGNPTVVVENMPGAGGRNVANFLYNVAPKDGTAIATMQHTTVYDAFGSRCPLRRPGYRLGMASFTSVGIAWHTSGVRTIEDAKTKQIVMGSSGAGATSFQWTNLMNHLIGTKFKILVGYKGAADIYVALERGELDGVAGTDWTSIRNGFQRWLDNKQINIFVQFATTPHPDLPKVFGDLVSSRKTRPCCASCSRISLRVRSWRRPTCRRRWRRRCAAASMRRPRIRRCWRRRRRSASTSTPLTALPCSGSSMSSTRRRSR